MKKGRLIIPDGWQLVPKEPTHKMLQGACPSHKPGKPMEGSDKECPHFIGRRNIWKKMLKAAPIHFEEVRGILK